MSDAVFEEFDRLGEGNAHAPRFIPDLVVGEAQRGHTRHDVGAVTRASRV